MIEEYTKPALTFQQQLAQLKSRNMIICEENQALSYLSNIGYYRLSAYWHPFKLKECTIDKFKSGTELVHVIELYEFDRRLRLLVMDAIERLEVAVRTRLAYHLAHRYGPFAHNDAANFHPKFNHAKWSLKLEEEIKQSKDVFITHYKNKYMGFPKIPIWMVTEVMSMGSLSICYSGLQNSEKGKIFDKKIIAEQFNLHYKRLEDWLHTLTYIRNICAHHSRLWNRELAIRPDQSKDLNWRAPITPSRNRIFYILLMLRYMLRSIGGGELWESHVIGRIIRYGANFIYLNPIPPNHNGGSNYLTDYHSPPNTLSLIMAVKSK